MFASCRRSAFLVLQVLTLPSQMLLTACFHAVLGFLWDSLPTPASAMHAHCAYYSAPNRVVGRRRLERCPSMLMPMQTFARVHFPLYAATFLLWCVEPYRNLPRGHLILPSVLKPQNSPT